MENSIEVPLKVRVELPYDPTIPHLSVYLYKNTNLKKYMHPKFLAALFTGAKIWNQHMCPSTVRDKQGRTNCLPHETTGSQQNTCYNWGESQNCTEGKKLEANHSLLPCSIYMKFPKEANAV